MDSEELRAAEAHIARLEEELLRLKDVKRDLQALHQEHQRLRRSVEGRFVKILTAPFRLLRARRTTPLKPTKYQQWFERHRVAGDEVRRLRERERAFAYRPLISILMPTFNTNEKHLEEALQSVFDQAYENWELIVVDDGSERRPALLEECAQSDARVRVFLEKHAGISAALNVGLAHAGGDFIALLDHDDMLEPDALFRAVEVLQNNRAIDLFYSDEDKLTEQGFDAPLFKPCWSPDLLLSLNYIGHLTLVRRRLAQEIGGFRSQFDGAQDYDFYFRVVERTQAIHHIPRVLYHWRRTADSTAHNIRRKPGVLEAARRSIEEHLARSQETARVTVDWSTHAFRVRRKTLAPKISILLLGEADEKSAAVIRERTSYPNLSIVTDPGALSELLVLLDADLQPVQENWLAVLAEFAQQPQIGAVGPRLLNADGNVESAGLVLLPGGVVSAAFAGMPRDFRGANRRLQTVRNCSALSASCLMTRRDVFQTIVGSDMATFRHERMCAGVEYCLKAINAGLRIVSVPYAEVQRSSRLIQENKACPELARRWPNVFACDPFYNPNLSRERADFSLGDPRHE
jgi:GT2 family glycosyltransferase